MINIGDRVRLLINENRFLHKGDLGIVVVFHNSGSVGVRWDNHISGHDCVGNCESGHGWYVSADNLEKCYKVYPRGTSNYDKLKGL